MNLDFPVRIARLTPGDGGRYLATVPMLPVCMSDGDTPEEALQNVQNAIAALIAAAKVWNQVIPQPKPYSN
jgi:predicted RNase H-like HicB family nuclease